MNYGHGPGPYIFDGPEGLEKAIDKSLAEKKDVRCPVCQGKAPGMRDGDQYVVGEHETLVDGNHGESCDGLGERVGHDAVIRTQPDTAASAT